MERPQGSWQPPQRQVTGEMLYIQDQWQKGVRPQSYSRLPEEARQVYEATAQDMQAAGTKPEILKLYEQHDGNPSPLATSCRALAETLLAIEDPTGETPHTRIVLPLEMPEIIGQLRELRVGELLLGENEQLALPADIAQGGIQDDIRKSIMIPRGMGFDVWREEHQYIPLNNSTAPAQSPRDFLLYPSDERARSFSLDLSFEYETHDGKYVVEMVSLRVDPAGKLHAFRTVDMQAYEQAQRPDYKSKALEDATEADIAAFADFLATIVGDNPETELQRHERHFHEAVERLPDELSQAYLNEWTANTSLTYVRLQVMSPLRKGKTFIDMLSNPETSASAHQELVAKVERARTRRRELIAAGAQLSQGEWHDIVPRMD